MSGRGRPGLQVEIRPPRAVPQEDGLVRADSDDEGGGEGDTGDAQGTLMAPLADDPAEGEAEYEANAPAETLVLNRTYVQGSTVPFDEDRTHEFKAIQKAGNPMKRICEYAPKYINAFLNTSGGTIYFGINDDGTVSGIYLSRKSRDGIRQQTDQQIERFWPPVDPSLVDVNFVSVTGPRVRPGTYIVEMTVLKGTETVYLANRSKGPAYIRRESSTYVMPMEMIFQRMGTSATSMGGGGGGGRTRGGNQDDQYKIAALPYDLIGREPEFQKIMRHIDASTSQSVIICLVGPAGVGKSALARRVTNALADAYPRQFPISLKGYSGQPLSSQEAMVHTIRAFQPLVALPSNPAELQGLYFACFYRNRSVLLLQDASTAEQVHQLVVPSKAVILVTSRRDLGLEQTAGALVLRLGDLSTTDASAMLAGMHPGLTSVQLQRVAQACGCFPLALRVAGALLSRHKNVPAEQLIARLEENNSAVMAPVTAAINASYQMLSPQRKLHFLSLSLFVGSFDDKAAAAVLNESLADAQAILTDLLTDTFVEFNAETWRYRLHGVVRAFAAKQLNQLATGAITLDNPPTSATRLNANQLDSPTLTSAMAANNNFNAAPTTTSAPEARAGPLVVIPQVNVVEHIVRNFVRYFSSVVQEASVLHNQGGVSRAQGRALFDRERHNILEALERCEDVLPDGVYEILLQGKDLFRSCFHSTKLIGVYERLRRRLGGAQLVNPPRAWSPTNQLGSDGEHESDLSVQSPIYNVAALFTPNVNDTERERRLALVETELAFALVAEGSATTQAMDVYLSALTIRRALVAREGEKEMGFLADTLQGLGELLADDCKYKDAELTLAESLDYRAKCLASDPCVRNRIAEAGTRLILGTCYREQAKFAEAKQTFESALETFSEVGAELEVAECNDALGKLAAMHGDTSTARARHLEALSTKERLIGPESVEVSLTRHRLAKVYMQEGQYARAEEEYQKSLEIRRTLGAEHPLVSNSLRHLGFLYLCLGEYARAEALYEQSMDILRRTVGVVRMDYAIALNDRGLLYSFENSYDKALALLTESLQLRQRLFPGPHPHIATCLNNLANVHRRTKQWELAEAEYKEALTIRRAVYGSVHPEVARTLHNIGVMHLYQDRLPEARAELEQSLAMRRKLFPPVHAEIAAGTAAMAQYMLQMHDYTAAETLLNDALRMNVEALGDKHPNVVHNLVSLADLHSHLKQFEKGEENLKRGLEMTIQQFGRHHTKTMKLVRHIEGFFRPYVRHLLGQNEPDKAEAVLKRELRMLFDSGLETCDTYGEVEKQLAKVRRRVDADKQRKPRAPRGGRSGEHKSREAAAGSSWLPAVIGVGMLAVLGFALTRKAPTPP